MHNSENIGNRFLALAKADDNTLTSMQLLKLVYIAHGWHLGLYQRPLILDEVQAWQYGPVIPRLYQHIRKFKGNPVTGPVGVQGDHEFTPQEESIISQVYELYGRQSGIALSRMTHAANTPWELTYEPGSFGTMIPNDLIEDHYSRLAQKTS